MKIKWTNQHDGHLVPDDEVVEDGDTVHVLLMLCDSMAGRRPGYAQPTDEQIVQRRAPRDRYIRDLSSAWRMDSRKSPDPDDDPDEDDDNDNNNNNDGRGGARLRRRNSDDAQVAARKATTLAYDQMVKRAENAWRQPVGPVRDNGEPDMSSSAETMRHHLRTEPDEDVQARRDAAWAQYRDQLANAWKTNPSAATAIQRQGERWRGGR
jgi:hypothetical protein